MRSRRRSRIGFVLLALVAIVLLAVISFLPLQDKIMLHTVGHYHLWGHIVAFAITTFLLLRLARSTRGALGLFILALVLGFLIEFCQHVINHESLEQVDVVADWSGALAGSILSRMLKTPAV